jgi:type IV secretory pathway ATPase VirB11/archaellum biosynthesis ATPase
MVDARLPDGSRVNAIIPPLSLRGPTLTIRKFSRDPYTMDDLINFGSVSPEAAQFLSACVRGKLNVLISGGTGTGKTTTLNALSAFVPNDERIVTIEDAAELQLQQDHVITLESRPPNIEGEGEIRIRELVRNALRMRPDRIIVGEVRGAETLDMLQAMNTGHEGSLTTIHANSPRDALSRLETLVMTAGVELPHRAIREQISSAFDLLVQISRLVDGSRRITHITEVLRMESDVITLQDVYIAKPPDEDDASEAGKPVNLLNRSRAPAEAPVPREDGRERGHPAAVVLRGQHGLPVELRGGELRRVRVSRRASRLLVAAVFAALVTPVAAGASLSLRGIDTSGYPTVRVTGRRPGREDGGPADPDRERQPGRRTQGDQPRRDQERRDRHRPFALDDRDEARGRSRSRPRLPEHQGAVGPRLRGRVRLAGGAADRFSSSTDRRRRRAAHDGLDAEVGHALYDALSLSASCCASRAAAPASSSCSPTARTSPAGLAGRRARAATRPARSSTRSRSAATARPPRRSSRWPGHGGSFNVGRDERRLTAVYSSIARELKRTWRVEYVTSARPGDKLHLRVRSIPRARRRPTSRSPAARAPDPAAARCRTRSTHRSVGCC